MIKTSRTPTRVKWQALSPTMPMWKKYARIILPHIGLIFISVVYIVGGACVFYFVESPNEHRIRAQGLEKISDQLEMLHVLWEVVNDPEMSKLEIEDIAVGYIDNTTRILFEAFDTHYISASHLVNASTVENSWTMTTAIFFTTTLLTTIGYGNQAPVTTHGRLICIVYALFGVPLILITVADIGKFLSENIIWLYTLYMDKRKKNRDLTSMNTLDDEEDQEKKELAQLGLEHYITIPIVLIATILLGYMMVGSGPVGAMGEVDVLRRILLLVHHNDDIGLAITTMCIDLAGLQYIRKIHYFGRAIADARYALVNVGGRMVHVGDILKYANVLQQKYGQKKNVNHPFVKGAYAPNDLAFIRFIDYSSVGSLESLASFVSSLFTKSTEPSMV
ncbi:TWiK family of potassium channels protein 7 [Aphelenchoides fujianensis]|nr:TWiK family of potassium channels protein 7 [Aphelenchoides fujianensis]